VWCGTCCSGGDCDDWTGSCSVAGHEFSTLERFVVVVVVVVVAGCPSAAVITATAAAAAVIAAATATAAVAAAAGSDGCGGGWPVPAVTGQPGPPAEELSPLPPLVFAPKGDCLVENDRLATALVVFFFGGGHFLFSSSEAAPFGPMHYMEVDGVCSSIPTNWWWWGGASYLGHGTQLSAECVHHNSLVRDPVNGKNKKNKHK